MNDKIVFSTNNGSRKFIPKFLVFFVNFGAVFLLVSDMSFLLFGKELSFISVIQKVASAGCLVFAVVVIFLRNSFIQFFKCSFVWLVLHLIAYFINPDISILFSRIIIYSYGNLVVLSCLFTTLDSFSDYLKAHIPYIFLSMLLSALQILCFAKTGKYSMQYSYYTVPIAIICLCQAKHNFVYYFPLGIIIITDLVCGSRGCFLCFIIAFLFIELMSGLNAKKIITSSILNIVLILIALNLSSVAKLALHILPNSRTLNYLSEGKLYLAGRDKYYKQLIGEIVNSKYTIHGLYSDRFFMAKYFSRTTMEDIYGSYSHNIIVEILFQFGWIGIPLLIFLLLRLMKSFLLVKRCKDEAQKTVWICFVSYAIGQLLVSSSYLTALSFGALVGVCMLIDKVQRKQNKNI